MSSSTPPPAYSSRTAAATAARPRLLPTLTIEPAAVVWPGFDEEGEAEDPDSVPVPVPAPPPPAPPKPAAPLGYLPNGSVRMRRPRRCRICVARGADGTLCVGRSSRSKCPHYVEGVDVNVIAMAGDSDDEET